MPLLEWHVEAGQTAVSGAFGRMRCRRGCRNMPLSFGAIRMAARWWSAPLLGWGKQSGERRPPASCPGHGQRPVTVTPSNAHTQRSGVAAEPRTRSQSHPLHSLPGTRPAGGPIQCVADRQFEIAASPFSRSLIIEMRRNRRPRRTIPCLLKGLTSGDSWLTQPQASLHTP